MSDDQLQEINEEEFQDKVLFYFNTFKDNVANTMKSIRSVITEDLKDNFTEHSVKRVVLELLLHFSAVNATDCLLNVIKDNREIILNNYISNINNRLDEHSFKIDMDQLTEVNENSN